MEGSSVRVEPVLKGRGALMMSVVWKSITFKWMIFSIILATVPLIIAGINIVQDYQEDLKESILALQKEKASRVAEKTRGFLGRATDDLQVIAGDEHLLRSGPSYTKDHLNRFLSRKDYLLELALLNEEGFEEVKVSKSNTEKSIDPKDQSMSPVFQTASRGKIYYGNFYYTSDGKPSLTIALPVEKYEGRPVGILKARIYLNPLTDLLFKTKIGEKGSTYVMDQEGYLVAHPGDKNIVLGPFVDRVIAGEEGNLEFENLRGEKHLVVYKPIHELKWGVIVQAPVEEAYKPLRKIGQTAIRWMLIASVLALAFSFFLTRRLTSPIKRLSNEMAKVSAGNLDIHVEPSTKDEVGQLTLSFNQMVKDLKQSREAIKEAETRYRNLFEHSKEMVYITSVDGQFIDVNQAGAEMLGYTQRDELMKVNIIDCYISSEERKKFQKRVAENGFVKDFEIKMRRKDGTLLDCLITATARMDPEGNIIGYEGTIKDISYRKRMEEELFQRTKELETLYDLSVLINQSLDLDLVLQIGLEKAMGITGFEIGALHILSEDGEALELKHEKGNPAILVEKIQRFRKGEGVCGTVVREKEPFLIDIEEYPTHWMIPLLKDQGVQTLAGIPLMSRDKAIGSITLLSRFRRQLTTREVHLLEGIGNQIGIALENAKLFSSVEKAKSEWETTFNTVTDLITIRDEDYRILRANRTAFIRYGLKPEEMIGKRCYEILHHRDAPCEDCYVTEALRTGRPASGERESGYLNGIFQYQTYPIYDDSKDLVAVVDLAREITEKKRIEVEKEIINNINQVIASTLDVRDVFKAVHSELDRAFRSERMAVILFDEDRQRFRFFALDKGHETKALMEGATYPLEGTPSEDVAQTGLPIIISNLEESDYWSSKALLKEGIRSLLVFPLEYKGKIIGTFHLGSFKPDHYSGKQLPLLQQIAPGLAISIQNALLLDEIKGSEERYRTVVEGSMDGVFVVGDDYRFRFVNKRLAEILGYARAELIGMDFREALDEESKALVADRYVRRQRGEDVPSQYEFKVIRKDGEIRNVEISASIVKDSKGSVSTIAFLKDVTEKKKMEEQLLQSEKLRALGEMASGVAHDFNNALAAILGNTQLLLYSVQEEEMRESLKTIEKVAKDSSRTVKRLQEFTRRNAPQELFTLDINSIIQDVIEITKPKWKEEAQAKGIRVDVMFDPGNVPGVGGNASEMREVFINILLNAIEAMPEGGRIEIQTLKRNGEVQIRVSDTGIGMTEGVRKKIFEPFFTTKPFNNTGLGLSMSYGIVKRFGGEIEVQSTVGSGTTFSIVLPVSGKEKEKVQPDLALSESKTIRILVIDDEETVRNVLSKMLVQFNHQVTVAGSGEEGIRLFGEKTFDMVLTDLGMPEMSGWEVCKSIKGMKPSTPVGMITGWGLEVDPYKKDEAGVDFIITKPFDFKQIIHVVSETMKLRATELS
jgi:PAS domain S-box-containing protein